MKNQISGRTKLYGLLAHPAQHSLSPLMHNLSFQVNQIDARYLAFDLEPDQLMEGIGAIRALKIGGVNLSMPFKQTVIPYLDEVSSRGQLLESVNVIKNENGRLIGDSVDGQGFFANLDEHQVAVEHATMTVFGAGGAGLSIIQAAVERQLDQVFVFKRKNRTFDKVDQQIKQMVQHHPTRIKLIDYDDELQMIEALEASRIIVNTTNLGMGDYKAKMPAPPGVLSHLRPDQTVCDAIYSPLETKFLTFAKQQHCQIINGLGMLVYQGALSFEFWTGQQMPIQQVKTLIKQQLAN